MKKLFILLFILIIGGSAFVYFSPMFEKVPPKITILNNGYTNLKNPIKIEISDNRGIKGYDIIMIANNRATQLAHQENLNQKSITLNLSLPKNINAKTITLIIKAYDTSKWHFFTGNKSEAKSELIVDKTPPMIDILTHSYGIGKGGSAAAVVEVRDKNLEDKYILVNNKYKFKLTPFIKDGYYASLLAWPITEDSFDATLVAIDKAGNKSTMHIPYYWRSGRIYSPKIAKIIITDKFINQVAKRVLSKIGFEIPNDPVEIFKLVNEKLRKINEKEISQITSQIYEDKVSSFYLNPFNPLPGSAKKADFGEIRHYFYKNEEISKSIHKGIDLAKVKHAKIYSSNYGKVIASKYIGIYGNTLIIYHKLGLYTLYGHTSKFKVKKGDKVRKGMVIAYTGATGAVFGDHLHFGVYIQGHSVQPIEWMDKHWIKVNISNVINSARRMINKWNKKA